jgi:hypothetical protein
MRAVCSSRRSAGWSILLTVRIVQRFGDAVELPASVESRPSFGSAQCFKVRSSYSWPKPL